MSIDDETLMAFADGALPEARAAQVAAAVGADPALAARVERFRAVRGRYAALELPGPDAAALMARAKAAVAAKAARRLVWPTALAAGLGGIALGAGVMLTRAGDAAYVPDMRAHGVLQAALDLTPSGVSLAKRGVRVSPLYTVVAADGRLCRAFRAERSSGASEGVACHGADGWRMVVVAQAAPGTGGGGFAPAATPEPAPVSAALDALRPGDPLRAGREAGLIAHGWRRE